MGFLKWYKRDPRAALGGMAGMTLAERGAYNAVLDLIYINDGAVPDDERFLARQMHTKIQVWRRVRLRLLSMGKIYVRDGCLRNERADTECEAAAQRFHKGVTSAEKRWATYNEIKALRDADPMLSTTRKKESFRATIVPLDRDYFEKQEAARQKRKEGKKTEQSDTPKDLA